MQKTNFGHFYPNNLLKVIKMVYNKINKTKNLRRVDFCKVEDESRLAQSKNVETLYPFWMKVNCCNNKFSQ